MTGRKEALGQSEQFLDFQERLSRVAPVERPVLLIGERGTGKELAANRLHYLSKRWDKPFVTLNCATLSPSLIESELFGYEKGAFTGAERRTVGRFEIASGGTLFLDEIGSIPLVAQEKILRVVEYGSFERVGSTESIEVDVRIVGATNVDLKEMALTNSFKGDLLDRLSFEVLFLPPLRFRKSDIMLLAEHFALRMSYELGREDGVGFSKKAEIALNDYHWPGNIRELKNVVERAVYRASTNLIKEVTFDPFLSPYHESSNNAENDNIPKMSSASSPNLLPELPSGPFDIKQTVEDYEKQLLSFALEACKHNQKKTAEYLGLRYDQLRGKIKKLGILKDIKNGS